MENQQSELKQIIDSNNIKYADVCIQKGIQYYDYENISINWGNLENYELIEKIGKGKYSDVYKGINTKTKQVVCIKILKPIRKKKIKREIKVLQNLQQGPHIIELLDIVRDQSSKTTSLVFEYVQNIDFRELYPTFQDFDVRYYMYQLLLAIDYCHSQGIMHRDVKPHNIVIDGQNKQLKLADWGLAEFYLPGKDYNVRVASRYYKAPELLVDYTYYDYSVDIWGFGCVLAGIVFYRDAFFMGKDNFDQLEQITRVLGTKELFNYLEKYSIELDDQYSYILGQHKKIDWKLFISKQNQHLANEEAIDLLSKTLIYDHSARYTASQCLEHSYFSPIRKLIRENQTK